MQHRNPLGNAAFGGAVGFCALAMVILHGLSMPNPGAAAPGPAQPTVRLVQADASGVSLELTAPALIHAAEMAEMARAGQPQAAGVGELTWPDAGGGPPLPAVTALVGVPPGADVALDVSTDAVRAVPGSMGQTGTPDHTAGWRAGPPSGAAEGKVAHPRGLRPDAPAALAGEAWVRDQRVVRVTFRPYRFDAVRHALVQHRRVRATLRFAAPGDGTSAAMTPGRPADDRGAVEPFDRLLRHGLANGDQARAWRADRAVFAQHVDAVALADARQSIAQAGDGPRLKVSVDRPGLYRLGHDDLEAAGMDVDAVDPRTFALTNRGEPVAIHVVGESDGRFDATDAVVFYGEPFRSPPSTIDWLGTPISGTLGDARYTQTNVYWLAAGGQRGARMGTRDGAPRPNTAAAAYARSTVRAEESKVWFTRHFTSDDVWLWHLFRVVEADPAVPISKSFAITLPGVAVGAAGATVRGEIVANASAAGSPDHHVRFMFNDPRTVVQEARWDGATRFAFQGQVPAAALRDGANRLLVDPRLQPGTTGDTLYFDWFEVTYPRRLAVEADALAFDALDASTRRYDVDGFTTPDAEVFDITRPNSPVRITGARVTAQGNRHAAAFQSSGDARFVAAAAGGYRAPAAVAWLPASPLAQPGAGADHVVVTPRSLHAAAQRLADHRARQGLRVAVVDVEDLYDAFNHGIFGPRAIRNFLAWAMATWPTPVPAYVVVVGDGHWNFLGHPAHADPSPILMPPNLEWVDPVQGEVDSANRLATVVGADPMPDVAIGRLPVRTAAELDAVIDKIVAYEAPGPQAWGRRHLFIADNTFVRPGIVDAAGDFAGATARFIESNLPDGAIADRIFLDRFIDAGACTNGTACAKASQAITRHLNITGALLVNFVGHGKVDWWSHEQMLNTAHLATLRNGEHLPIVLSWTCLDGYWSYPAWQSMAESLVRLPRAGAVATFSPTGLGVMTGHELLQAGFYDAVYGAGQTIFGPATVAAKLRLFRSGANVDLLHTYTLFGDPALRIPVPVGPFEPTPTSTAARTTPASPPTPGATPTVEGRRGSVYLPALYNATPTGASAGRARPDRRHGRIRSRPRPAVAADEIAGM
ncbi:hypothetical protein DCC79_00870 [bacterium]|nr:MAG: hypothetical protein DCC79_00870 [bacterium]